jgi:hypothetical protein
MPLCKNIGKVINNTKDGITSQNICVDKSEILAISLVSKYSQIIAMTEINGKEANRAPMIEFLFDNSDMTTINNVVNDILMMY